MGQGGRFRVGEIECGFRTEPDREFDHLASSLDVGVGVTVASFALLPVLLLLNQANINGGGIGFGDPGFDSFAIVRLLMEPLA